MGVMAGGRRDKGDPLREYRRKRDFARTSEPAPDPAAPAGAPGESAAGPRGAGDAAALPPGVESGAYVVQQHAARRMHYDVRLEVGGVLKSWAVPKGPSTDPAEKRLAVPTEDHPLAYQHYEGVIPQGSYGAGPSLLWDRGRYVNISHHGGRPVPMAQALRDGHVSVWFQGEKLAGGYALTRIERSRDGREAWLLVKRADAAADAGRDITAELPRSVASGRTIEELRADGG